MPDEYETRYLPPPIWGVNKRDEPIHLDPRFSPNMKNMVVEKTHVRKRLGYSVVGTNLPLDGIGMDILRYVDTRASAHHIAMMNKLAYEYDGDGDIWECISPTTEIDDFDTAANWNAGTGCSVAQETTIKKEGTGSLKLTISSSRSDGDKLAYCNDFGAKNVSSYGANGYVLFWIRSDTALSIGDIEIVLAEASAGAKTGDYVEVTNDVAITANTWYLIQSPETLTNLNAIVSVGVYANASLDGSGTPINIYFDHLQAHQAWTGDADDRFSHGMVTDTTEFSNNGGRALLVSNGKDKPYYYEGQAADLFQVMTNEPASFAYTQELVEFWNHLFYIVPNDGNNNAQGISAAAAGDTSLWNGASTSFDTTLTDVIGKLLRGIKLLYDLVLYGDECMTICNRVNETVLFVMPTVIYNLGLISERAVHAFPEFHAFIGTDEKFHIYAMGTTAPIICDEVAEAFFEELDISKKEKIVLGHDVGRHKLYFFFPKTSDTYAKNYYAWNYDKQPKSIEYGEFADNVRGMCQLSAGVAWTCDGEHYSGVNCDETADLCSDAYGLVDKLKTVFLTDDGYVHYLNESFGTDNGTNIEALVETMDVTLVPGSIANYGRFSEFGFEAKSCFANGTANVYYSTDGGSSWTEFTDSPVSLSTSWTWHRLPFDVVSRKCRWKIRQNSSKDLQIRDMFYKIKPREGR